MIPKYVTITQSFDAGYIAYHPELPTVMSQADTPEEARANLVEATEMALRHLIDNGLPVPSPMAFPLAVDFTHGVAMYGSLPYNPFGPHAPQQAALRQSSGCTPVADVPLARIEAAEKAGATHLSADGETAYDERQLGVWRCFWYEDQKRFGSWFKCDELPAGAVPKGDWQSLMVLK